jgi:fibronectin type 3 domain-containing protein
VNGWITFTQVTGNPDPDFPHIQMIEGSELNAGRHENIELTNLPELVDGAVYSIEFDGVDFADNQAITVTVGNIRYDISSPSRPESVRAIAGDAEVALDWVAPPEEDIHYYKIYRNKDAVFSLDDSVRAIFGPQTTWTSAGLTNDTVYYYSVSAVDSAGNESSRSDSVAVMPIDLSPNRPRNLTGIPGDLLVFLSWSPNEDWDLAYYQVYRSENPQFADAIAVLDVQPPDTSCVDSDVVPGATLYYWIVAVDLSGNESLPSDSVEVVAGSSPEFSALPDTTFAEDDSLKIHLSWLSQYVDDDNTPDSLLAWEFSSGNDLEISTDNVSLVLQARPDWFGRDTVTVIVTDEIGLRDTTVWMISVLPVNDPPFFMSRIEDIQMGFNDVLTVDMKGYIKDIDDGYAGLSLAVVAAHLMVVPMDTLMLQLRPQAGYFGQDSVIVNISDTSGAAASDTFGVRVRSVSSVPEIGFTPAEFALSQNYPNPFNLEASILIDLPEDCLVELKVYNSAGQLVRQLVNEKRRAGRYIVTWKGDDQRGAKGPSGVYFYEMRAGDFVDRKRMVLLK